MKINHNMSATIANKRLLASDRSLSASIERLSTGLRINRASDDAAGLAIATKMKSQIKGLDQASRNASDGISVLDTADGALTEVHSMLQRMRELSVQAANNGVYTLEDLEAIQAEISSLRDEIDRVSKDTEFNKKNLLDGTLDQRIYPDNRGITRISISDAVNPNNYAVNIGADATHAKVVGTKSIGRNEVVTANQAGIVSINGVDVPIKEGDTFSEVYEKLREGAELGEVNLMVVANLGDQSGTPDNEGYVPTPPADGGYLVFVSDEYGSSTEMHIKCTYADLPEDAAEDADLPVNAELAAFLGIQVDNQDVGKDVEVTIPADTATFSSGFDSQRTVLTDGNYVTITSRNGFEMKFEVTPKTNGRVNLEVTDIGTMTLQIGANENQTVEVRIPEISARALYIDKVDVCTITGAGRAITSFDKAIAKVSEVRSSIGAYQNRLDYTVSSLDGTELNMTQALSRIEDLDMAEEMTEYTKYTVLTQAATSVLAQANDLPQQVLQLLQ